MSSYYGLDLEKIESAFQEVLKTGDDRQIAEFAKEIIPLLIKDANKTRMEFVDNPLKQSTLH